jgi:uncharacterized membrane protein YhaH (DUF805 family)
MTADSLTVFLGLAGGAGRAALQGLAATYLLWIFYLAVMALKRARDAGQLSPLAFALGVLVLKVGLVLDVLVNVLVMTVVLVEPPREWLVTTRLAVQVRQLVRAIS